MSWAAPVTATNTWQRTYFIRDRRTVSIRGKARHLVAKARAERAAFFNRAKVTRRI